MTYRRRKHDLNKFSISLYNLLYTKDKTQKELAAHLGVPDNTVSYFVSGRRTPNTEQIAKIADFFDVSADYLLGRTNAETTDKDLRFICEYTGLSENTIMTLRNSGGIWENLTIEYDDIVILIKKQNN